MIGRRPALLASWAALALVVVVGLGIATFGAGDPTPSERVHDLSGQFACPKCDGQAVRDSNAGSAAAIRAEIARRVEAGQSDDEILDALAAAYGRSNLLTPSATGASSLVWALPVAGVIVVVAALAWTFVRRSPQRGAEVDDEDRALVEAARRRRGRS